MADQKRNPNRGQRQGHDSHQRDETQQTQGGQRDRMPHDESSPPGATERDRGSMADDRGMSGEDDALAGERVLESDVDDELSEDEEDDELSGR